MLCCQQGRRARNGILHLQPFGAICPTKLTIVQSRRIAQKLRMFSDSPESSRFWSTSAYPKIRYNF
jgi:hypothetical protein